MRNTRSLHVRSAVVVALVALSGCADLFGRHEGRADSPTSGEPRVRLGPAQEWVRSPPGRGVPEVLTGNVIIRSAPTGPDYEVLLDIREGARAPDGMADRVWVLQMNMARRAIRPIVIEDARLFSRPGELLVAPPRGPYAFEFTIGEFPARLTENLPPDWRVQREQFLHGRQIGQRWQGVGVAQRVGQWPLSADAELPARTVLLARSAW